MKSFICFTLIMLFSLTSCSGNKHHLVQIKDQRFEVNEHSYVFIGASYWHGINLGAPKSGDRERLRDEIHHFSGTTDRSG